MQGVIIVIMIIFVVVVISILRPINQIFVHLNIFKKSNFA